MKILLISPLPPPSGGIASWTKRYFESRQVKENEVVLINSAVVGSRIKKLGTRKLFDEIKRTINIIKLLKYHLLTSNLELVHINTSCGKYGLVRDYFCAKLAKKKGCKVLLHCHCDVSYMVNSGLAEFYYRKLVDLSDEIITLNATSQQFTLDKCKKESTIIPNFLPDCFLDVDTLPKGQKCARNCLYVGHVSKAKGCGLLLNVARNMPHLTFTIVGLMSEEIDKLLKPNNVEFTGEVSKDQVIEYMLKADVFVFPSYSEGFPTVILEAMACRLPIVATGVGAIPDMIEDKGGIMVEVGDVRGFKTALEWLQHDSEMRERMGNWNRTKVKSFYTEQKIMGSLMKKYKELLGD